MSEIDVKREGQEETIKVVSQKYDVGFFPSGTLDIMSNGDYDVNSYANIHASVTPILQNKEVTITTNGDTTVQADENYEGIGTLTIHADVVSENNAKTGSRRCCRIFGWRFR